MQVIVGKMKAQRQAESKSRVNTSKSRSISLPEEPTPEKDPRATFSEPIQSSAGFVSFLNYCILAYCKEARFLCLFICLFLFFKSFLRINTSTRTTYRNACLIFICSHVIYTSVLYLVVLSYAIPSYMQTFLLIFFPSSDKAIRWDSLNENAVSTIFQSNTQTFRQKTSTVAY